ncbi:MAG TPA: sulfite exporter TauE/SafE family protein [Luteolibacter sp.]|nr:sulfite exporter TauE/SafE family protein [Luteolibacter sp.]
MNPLAWLGAVLIGLSLGLTGAGGSILTLPVLVHLAGVPPREAVPLSLLVVGSAAFVGALQRMRSGALHVRAAAMFVLAGAAGAVPGAQLTPMVSPAALMIIFAVIMVAVAVRMLRGSDAAVAPAPECRPVRCLLAGGGVGVLTGFLGVGGGFLLVPALVKFARLPLPLATGTSLAIIACNSAAGFAGHLGTGAIDWKIAATFSIIAAAGVVIGGKFAGLLPQRTLRRGFALLVLLTAAFVLTKSLV